METEIKSLKEEAQEAFEGLDFSPLWADQEESNLSGIVPWIVLAVNVVILLVVIFK